ncbi:MAG: hypothetical protein ABSA02_39085 [Trebonia sp.]
MQVTSGTVGLTGATRRLPTPTRHHLHCLTAAAAFRSVTASLAGWLASLPHRAGARLFAMNDTEAGWRGWKVTELYGGLGRSYRDPRFDLLRALRALGLPAPVTDPPKTVRPADGWDDVHGWPWDGEG